MLHYRVSQPGMIVYICLMKDGMANVRRVIYAPNAPNPLAAVIVLLFCDLLSSHFVDGSSLKYC